MPDTKKSKFRPAGEVFLGLLALLVIGLILSSPARSQQQGGLDLQVEVTSPADQTAIPPYPPQPGEAPVYGAQPALPPAPPQGGVAPVYGSQGDVGGAPAYGETGQDFLGAQPYSTPPPGDFGFDNPMGQQPGDIPAVPTDAPPPVPPSLGADQPVEEPTPQTPEEMALQEARNEAYGKLQEWHNSIMSGYVFNTGMMADPFMPIESVARPPEAPQREEDIKKKPMLQRLALNQFVLSAIIVANDPSETSALVDSGGRGYILKRGTLIGPNNGYVKEIGQDRVVIEEPEVNYLGETRMRETVLRLDQLDEDLELFEE
jgi:type IV pilus assembly protein PilP